ncbi:hypothetical protein B566_EDAN019532, partial [Ephemera danica]
MLTDHAFSVKTWKNEVVYNFTQIFKAETGQKEVYDNTAGSSVEPFIKGKDCLMLAYGTTNAGKTYSVQGTSFPLLPLQLGNCSLSFSSALSSTVSADFDPGVGDSTEPSLAENYGWKSSSRCS